MTKEYFPGEKVATVVFLTASQKEAGFFSGPTRSVNSVNKQVK